jgi:hypothetical protein
VPEARSDRWPRSDAEGADLGPEISKPGFGSNGDVVPEARNEGSAGFQACSDVPPGLCVTVEPGTPIYKLDPERAAELERIFSETIPEINACTDDASPAAVALARNSQLTTHNFSMDAPPLSRSDRVGTRTPSLFFIPRRQNSVPSFATRDQLTTHDTPTQRAEHASPARQCWVQNRGEAPSSLPQALSLCSRLTTFRWMPALQP